ncbi:MAG: hypothetical protein SOR11_04395 [Fusobacterium sp.]|uniref:hypothetical protein n=1 Tax=Fusobacterium sp. TaxID=68766 RepID=UPI002A748A7D|nr:hypothetical protein [Fusobacterium sp.]MDY3059224.1 hypothetical protein [Fusobacterium sp.]
MNEIALYQESESLIFKKQVELLDLETELKNTEIYKRVEQAKKELEELKKDSENKQNAIITAMLDRGVKQLEVNNLTVKIKNTARDRVEVLDMAQIPSEYIRIKPEVDKNGILKLYRETGVIVPGTDVVKDDKYKLEIKNK